MNHQDLINTCVFEQIQGLLFSDLSGPLKDRFSLQSVVKYFTRNQFHCPVGPILATGNVKSG